MYKLIDAKGGVTGITRHLNGEEIWGRKTSYGELVNNLTGGLPTGFMASALIAMRNIKMILGQAMSAIFLNIRTILYPLDYFFTT